jgi:hypothetical protein
MEPTQVLVPEIMHNGPQRMPMPQQAAPADKPQSIGIELFVEDLPASDARPRTLFDAAWPITWTNVPAVLEDVAKALKGWGITSPKPIVLRFDNRKVNRDVVSMLMDYIVLTVRNASLEAIIEVPGKNAPAERLPESVAGV